MRKMTHGDICNPEESALVGVTRGKFYHRHPVPFDDEGTDRGLWVMLDTFGPCAVVRADSFQDAWESCIDAMPTVPIDDVDECRDKETGDLREGYEFQSNASGSGIVALDINGQQLCPLSQELADEYGIELAWEWF